MRGEFDSLRGNKNGDMAEWLRRRSAKSVTWVRILLSPQRVRWKPKSRWWIYVHQNAEGSGDRRWLISISRMARYHFSVQDALSLYVYKWEVQKHTFCLDGVMGAYLSYIQMVGVQFPLEVQKSKIWAVKCLKFEQYKKLGSKSRSDTAARL